VPNRRKLKQKLTVESLRKIAEIKLPDLNTDDVNQAMRTIAGSAQSMGVLIDGEF
jgi:large subunit ribosomal protein L11